MANNKLLVDERQTDLGNFMVGRLLPFRKKRQVGPFTFIDHMGPAKLGNGKYIDVDQHPHIGLSTLTYLYEGEIEHRDSIGSNQIIRPGDVGFMTSGKGVTHTERTPQYRRNGEEFTAHGYQIWVALPKNMEEINPHFNYYPSTEIPTWQTDTLTFRLVAGNAFGKSAPLQGYSPLFMVDIFAKKATTLKLKGQIKGDVALVIVKGTITNEEQKVTAGQMLISKTNDECEICLDANTQLLLFGGEPLPQEHFLLWNFVSHSKDRLKLAKEDWINKKFPKVEGDKTYIPFPKL
ncbi:pirin family protein [Aurantibacter crassamenti]|uniref:pirin family protein n=1 Tax=Aurantibacter crassamenti TaxID=1837375 RepID=UPI001939A746|nr:pirin family protein [Aurantibacter crassamenti]MBM1104540.1 pirin family protein [Aurantibacter crassamenti]